MKRFVSVVSIGALAALASGCALQPAYERPADAAPAAWPAGPAYAAAGASGTIPAADTGWQDFLADPRLRPLVGIALANNQDLRIALLRVSQARAALQLQRSAALPQVGVEASGTRGRSASTGNTTHTHFAGLAASWEIDLFCRLQSLTEAAREQYLASAHARQAAHILLVAQVAEQYLAMQAYDEQLAVTNETLAAARESYRIVKLQFDTGTVSELDETLARGTVEQAVANHAAQQRLRAQAENALVLLLGQPLPPAGAPDTPLDRQPMLAAQFPAIPAGLPSELLLRRPDVLQAEHQLIAQNANIGAARAAMFPRISLTATLGTISTALSGLFAGGSFTYTGAPAVSLPLFDGGRLRGGVDAARAQQQAAVSTYERAVQTAFREVADALAQRGTIDEQISAQTARVESASVALKISDARYRAGVESFLTTLDSQRVAYAAQQQLVTTRLNRESNLVELYRSLGGGTGESGEADRRQTP